MGPNALHRNSEDAGLAGDETPGEGDCGSRIPVGSDLAQAPRDTRDSGSQRRIRCRKSNSCGRRVSPGRPDAAPGNNGAGKPMLVRLTAEDRLLLDARAEARGMRPATYASVLLRSHLRQLTPLPKDELLALKRSIAELGSIGRNINQIARAVSGGGEVCRTLWARSFGRCLRYARRCGTTPRRFSMQT